MPQTREEGARKAANGTRLDVRSLTSHGRRGGCGWVRSVASAAEQAAYEWARECGSERSVEKQWEGGS